MDGQAGDGRSFGQRRDWLERLPRQLVGEVDPRSQAVERPGENVERPLIAGQRQGVAKQAMLPWRQAGGQAGEAGPGSCWKAGGQGLVGDRVQEGRRRTVPSQQFPPQPVNQQKADAAARLQPERVVEASQPDGAQQRRHGLA